MPVFSYIAIPHQGAKERLCAELSELEYCEVVPADNQDVIVLVTDTPDELREQALQQILKGVTSLQSLSLTFGYEEKE
jgi:nitrate reductase NapAB chaperone NapD